MGRSATNMMLAIFLLFAGFGDPFAPEQLLPFCQLASSPCCTFKHRDPRNHVQAMDIRSSSSCQSLLESVLGSKCNCTDSKSSFSAIGFCSKLKKVCQTEPISDSPYANTSSSHILSELWKSEPQFPRGSEDGSSFVREDRVLLSNSSDAAPPSGICLEKIGNGMYLNMIPHPDGSSRVFLADQGGKVWLASVPEQGSGKILTLDDSSPFVDISSWVYNKNELGMMGMAFHPQFLSNGRFFLSFNCERGSWSGCVGRCSCNSDLRCDPSQLPPDQGTKPCQFQSVISEFTVNDTAAQPSLATSAFPKEVRRIFTMGLPFTTHHGGQILFGPEDRYLYFMMGDGGNTGDPYNFAQNKKSLLGKIMRLDVDSNLNSVSSRSWGSYSIPRDNPYSRDASLAPEIWALGFRNPWRCSFDLKRPSYFLCADVGQDNYEEVDIVKKGGNYGWRVYEGPYLYKPPRSPGGNTSARSIKPIFPVMGYNHSEVTTGERSSASITGGHFYRSTADPCLAGRYLFADLYSAMIWAGTESPENSGNFTRTMLKTGCASDSPQPCMSDSLGIVFSFGQDNRNDSFILTTTGVYRVVRPSRCKFACSKENVTAAPAPSPMSRPQPPSISNAPAGISLSIFINIALFCLLAVNILGPCCLH